MPKGKRLQEIVDVERQIVPMGLMLQYRMRLPIANFTRFVLVRSAIPHFQSRICPFSIPPSSSSNPSLPPIHLSAASCFSYLMAAVILTVGIAAIGAWKLPNYSQIARSEKRNGLEDGIQKLAQPLSSSSSVGRITGMVDCRWDKPNEKTICGATVSLGRKYALASGLVEITYDTGAKVVLQGPVTYEVESKNGGFLSVGKLAGRMGSETAKGFSVRTPTAIVTDLGTEFCVEVHKDQTSDVYVRSGKVELVTRKGGQRQLLQADGSGSVMRAGRVEANGDQGNLRIVSVALDPNRFADMVSRLNVSEQANNGGERILVQSRFTLSTEGWLTTPSGTGAQYLRELGHPGGCIQTGQNPKNNETFYYIASPMFSGDRSGAFGGQLKFDVYTSFVNPNEPLPKRLFWMEQPLVILESRKNRIATDLPSEFKRNQWTTLSVRLDATAKWYRFVGDRNSLEGKQTDRTPVSDDVVREVLSDLREMWIRAEYLRGEDYGRLDNVLFIAPNSSVSGKRQDDMTDSVLGSATGGKRVPGAAPQINVRSGTK